jgi:hypothetical protein
MTDKPKHWRDAMNERNQDWINSREKPKTDQWHGGKGSRSRRIDKEKYSENWDKIFSNKEKASGASDNQESTE